LRGPAGAGSDEEGEAGVEVDVDEDGEVGVEGEEEVGVEVEGEAGLGGSAALAATPLKSGSSAIWRCASARASARSA